MTRKQFKTPVMRVSIPKASASTNLPMGLNGILRSIRWGFPFVPTVQARMFPMMLGCHSMLTQNMEYFRLKPMNIPKINILLDHGYHPEHLAQELEKVYPQIMQEN